MNIEEHNFRTWLDKYFDLFSQKSPVAVSSISGLAIYCHLCQTPTALLDVAVSSISGLAIYSFGLAISIIGKFTGLYAKGYITYLALFCIIWVASWMRWGHFEFFRIINAFPFSSDDSENGDLMAVLSAKLKLATDNRLLLTVSLFLTLAFYSFIIGFWFLEPKFRRKWQGIES